MAELKANNQKPNFDNNPKLIEAIAEMRKNFCAETQNKVINTALACTFLVPAMVEKTTELVADAENHVNFEDKSKAKFILLNNNKTNGTFFPVFTSPEEAKKLQYDKPFQSFAMRFQDIAALTEQTPKVQGFVVNPFGEDLPFTQEMLESIKQTLIKVAKKLLKMAKLLTLLLQTTKQQSKILKHIWRTDCVRPLFLPVYKNLIIEVRVLFLRKLCLIWLTKNMLCVIIVVIWWEI